MFDEQAPVKLPEIGFDLSYAHLIFDEIERYGEEKNLKAKMEDLREERPVKIKDQNDIHYCHRIQRIISRSQTLTGEKIRSSEELDLEIRAYCNEHLTSRVLGFQRSHVLRKRLFKLMDKELPLAIRRENTTMRAFIAASENAVKRKELADKVEELEEEVKGKDAELEKLRGMLAEDHDEILDKDEEIRFLKETNSNLRKEIELLRVEVSELRPLRDEVAELRPLTGEVAEMRKELLRLGEAEKITTRVLSQSFFNSEPAGSLGDEVGRSYSGLRGFSLRMEDFSDGE